MAVNPYYRDMRTPGNPIYQITETQWRTLLSAYVQQVDIMENELVADTNWFIGPYFHLWKSATGTFNPTTSTAASNLTNAKPTNRPGDTVY